MSSSPNNLKYTKRHLPGIIGKTGYSLLVIGLVLTILAYFTDYTRAAFNNVWVLAFVISIGTGALLLIAIEYVAGAVWSTPFRRIPEFLSSNVLVLPLIILPAIFGLHELYHWSHTEAVASDTVLLNKAPYLNEMSFIVRQVVYVIIWSVFYFIFTTSSRKQDTSGDPKITKRNIKFSAIFIPLFALSVTFVSVDWLMSLEAHWFSTIFGVYYFIGSLTTALAFATFFIVYLGEKGLLFKNILPDHYYSLGALLFAFINFWAYIAFSQFMLIWYGNLPEETFWFLQRWEGTWAYVTLGLIVVHFLVPYVGLLSQPSKMNPKRLKIMSAWIIFAHIYDLFWIVFPTYSKDGLIFGWQEIGAIMLMLGIVISVFVFSARNKNLMPIGDPKLQRGINFRL